MNRGEEWMVSLEQKCLECKMVCNGPFDDSGVPVAVQRDPGVYPGCDKHRPNEGSKRSL